ncbi:hypothetical protein FNF27_06443 [Cafeteria roenbergensis]|uniref:MRH domain-containing protein n=1 Tax=Cafeteria roenbergensis TaxID=33653 RepID=A0A5A8CKW9_CAFRO|nr:hypothetical protein FNF29_03599 [Cafeteria roenbergensis]KAA0159589.1 hypothetical protein FNF28_05793 [Cafeteria roenbergensis]KAA0165807.1 hypothetical protein FNF31_01784 [Cafeteria roenbergensis]KAA0170966.1 hypothetical protein FNF27_06443 [Cafeteria roenbergensis]|eukprot:KAA0152710.1 hypothetical protein FNF29_03599 [Cafeteria roenbergensis]
MLLSLAGLALAATLAVTEVKAGPGSLCDARYECKYHFQTDTDLWFFDFSNLCQPNGYYSALQDGRPGTNFTFNICGKSSQVCPQFNNNPFLPTQGVAIQNYGSTCVLAAEGAPFYQVRDPKNPETGGINITHDAAPEQIDDPNRCTPLPDGTSVFRSTTFMFTCDKSVQTLQATGAYEESECKYVIRIRSAFGCGRIYDGPDSKAAEDKEAGERGAEAGAVIGFMILGGILFVIVWAGIFYYYHREIPFSIPFVGNLARTPAAPSGGGFGASGSGFGASGAGGSYAPTA